MTEQKFSNDFIMLYLGHLAVDFITMLILVKLTCRILPLYFRLTGLGHTFIAINNLLSISVCIFSMEQIYHLTEN